MIAAVIKDDAEIDDREPCEESALGRFHDALLDSGNVVARDGAAENVIHELELTAARQRFHLDLAVAVLAVSAGLLLVAALHIRFAADGLAIWHLGRLEHDFSVIPLLEF